MHVKQGVGAVTIPETRPFCWTLCATMSMIASTSAAVKVSWKAFSRSGFHLTRRTCFNKPRSGNELYRAGGISSLFRLPIQESKPEGLDACFVGVPMDIGCSNRSGTRHGPRAIRHESAVIRYISDIGASPFESLQVADIGDVTVIPYNMERTIDAITDYFTRILEADCVPLAMGGDHTMSYPILRAIKKKHGTVGLIQIDAHQDLQDTMLGEKVAHGTPFRRALEEDLVDPKHFVQIGLRGSMNKSDIEEQILEPQRKVCSMVMGTFETTSCRVLMIPGCHQLCLHFSRQRIVLLFVSLSYRVLRRFQRTSVGINH